MILLVCLDLKDNYELSCVVNDEKLVKHMMSKSIHLYKLAISLYEGKLFNFICAELLNINILV